MPQAERGQFVPCPNPRCGKPVRRDQNDAWCHECGEYFPDDFAMQLPRLMESRGVVNPVGSSATSWQPEAPRLGEELPGPAVESGTLRTRAVMKRYREAYRVANIISSVGDSIKTIGITVAVIFGFIGLFAASQMGMLGVFAGLFSSASLGILSWLSGVLLNSQGQQLLAALDGAVSTSPFLTDDERAEIMTLP